jgi:hypothetical protein
MVIHELELTPTLRGLYTLLIIITLIGPGPWGAGGVLADPTGPMDGISSAVERRALGLAVGIQELGAETPALE